MRYNGGDGSLNLGCSAKGIMVGLAVFVAGMWFGGYAYALWTVFTTTDVLEAIRAAMVVVIMTTVMVAANRR